MDNADNKPLTLESYFESRVNGDKKALQDGLNSLEEILKPFP